MAFQHQFLLLSQKPAIEKLLLLIPLCNSCDTKTIIGYYQADHRIFFTQIPNKLSFQSINDKWKRQRSNEL